MRQVDVRSFSDGTLPWYFCLVSRESINLILLSLICFVLLQVPPNSIIGNLAKFVTEEAFKEMNAAVSEAQK